MQAQFLDLNAEQRAAVTTQAQHTLVLAGAGSGKTRVLTLRMVWLMQEQQVHPLHLLAVTFTNKAAKEMLLRLQALLPLSVRSMWVGTFHGLCHRLLRLHAKTAGLPSSFQILDTQDQQSALKRLYKTHGFSDEKTPIKAALSFISRCKEEGLRAKDVQGSHAKERQLLEIYQKYEEQCEREGVLDFSELLLKCFELLRDHADLRAHYHGRFEHILVDEFQDTNTLQYRWLQLLTGSRTHVFAVGDDDQSIYAFRGAKVSNMLDFAKQFQINEPIKLEQNYRSHGHILQAANHLIRHNQNRLGKELRTADGDGERIRVIEAETDFEEAKAIQRQIKEQNQWGIALSEMAVLYRSNAQSRVLETVFINSGIPYRIYGGLRFFDRAEVKNALAYLRLIENPKDDTSFLRIINMPPRGIGAKSIEKIQEAAKTYDSALLNAVPAVTGRAANALNAFVAQIRSWQEVAKQVSLPELIQQVLEQSGLLAHYKAHDDGVDRLENLEELIHAAQDFLQQDAASSSLNEEADVSFMPEDIPISTASTLVDFLSYSALESATQGAQAEQDAVQMMTIHAAKGLEFNTVFMTGLENGLFPHENSSFDPSGLEEERRLMYVAITRARRHLFLTYANSRMLHGQTRFSSPSSFLQELPESSLEFLRASPQLGFLSTSASANHRKHAYDNNAPSHFSKGSVEVWAEPIVKKQDQYGFVKGQWVFHSKLGQGKILQLEGQSAEAKAQVEFTRHGVKWLALSVAKLMPIES